MKADTVAREKAEALRRKGLSYNEIREYVPVSKSSLSLWLKNIRLSKRQRERLYTKQIQILSRGAPSQKERRRKEVEQIINAARTEIRLPLSKDTLRLFGAALYWAEGTKSKGFEITNSDPMLIAFMVNWFQQMFNINSRDLKAHLNIYSQQNEKHLKRFWSHLTGIPIENFGKSFVKPPNKGYKKNDLYLGTIKIRVAKGTDMKHKTFGWIQGALQELLPEIESVQRKWVFKSRKEHSAVNV